MPVSVTEAQIIIIAVSMFMCGAATALFILGRTAVEL